MSNNIYVANHYLSKLTLPHNQILYYGDFGLVWGIRKPHGLPTTSGNETSLLDIIHTNQSTLDIFHQGNEYFGYEQEYGMLNRIDNDTAGMVRFAKIPEVKTQWITDQQQGMITKIYHATVVGWIHEPVTINIPIQHHRFDDQKMIIYDQISSLGRGRTHHVETIIEPLKIVENYTHIQASIHQGCRHQIRLHCKYNQTPIIGDPIYGSKRHQQNPLHLWSIGIIRDKLPSPIIIHQPS